jgi:hypothetical protein
MRETMARGEWWDVAAPYGTNGYQFGRGEVVTGGTVLREVTFDMQPGDPNCVARGVAEMTDGRVYMFTVRKPGHGPEYDGRERPRLATLSRQGFAETAHGLLNWEEDGGRVSEGDAMLYRQEIDNAR